MAGFFDDRADALICRQTIKKARVPHGSRTKKIIIMK